MVHMQCCFSGELATISIKPYKSGRSGTKINLRVNDISEVEYKDLANGLTEVTFYIEDTRISYDAGKYEVEGLKKFLAKNKDIT